jgi:hypothetical protein
MAYNKSYSDEYYDFGKLTKHTGMYSQSQIVITRIKNKPLYKDTTRALRIWLNTEPSYFYIPQYKNFNHILSNLGIEDSISIYTKKKVLDIFGFGGSNQIVHLVNEEKRKTVIDFLHTQAAASDFKYVTAIATIFFLFGL